MTHAEDWARLARVAELVQIVEDLDRTFYPESMKEWTSAAEMVERIEPIVRKGRYILASIREELERVKEAQQ